MAVEAVADIRSVRYAFDDTVLLSKLSNLQSAEVLSRCSIDGIEIAIFFLELIHALVDMFHDLQCKSTVFHK